MTAYVDIGETPSQAGGVTETYQKLCQAHDMPCFSYYSQEFFLSIFDS